MISGIEYLWIALAAMAAGMVNALAGGGTLITFPVLVAMGLPGVTANVTNTVSLTPGYLGATFAQAKDLKGQKKRLWMALPAGVIGGLVGGILLLVSGERLFEALIPYLILLASALLAVQDPLRGWLQRRANREGTGALPEQGASLPIALAAVYGGYFGAGLSVIVLAALGLFLEDNLTRLNALKQLISFSVNVTAAVLFLFSGKVYWLAVPVMMAGALLGGALGGRLAGKVKPSTLRYIVVAIGTIIGIVYLVR